MVNYGKFFLRGLNWGGDERCSANVRQLWNFRWIDLKAGFPLGEFVRANKQKANVIGWWWRQCLSPANQVASFSVRANKFAKWKTGLKGYVQVCSIPVYYMDKGILLATKTLVESIRHYIRDPRGVFFVCHAREWYIDKFPPFLLFFSKNGRRVQGLWSSAKTTFITFANNKKMLICLQVLLVYLLLL